MTRREAQAALDALGGERRVLTAQEHRRKDGTLMGGSASWRGIASYRPTLAEALADVVRIATAGTVTP